MNKKERVATTSIISLPKGKISVVRLGWSDLKFLDYYLLLISHILEMENIIDLRLVIILFWFTKWRVLMQIYLSSFSKQNAKGKEVNLVKRDRSYKRTRNKWSNPGCKNFKIFTFLYRKDIPKAFFYSTLNLKRLGSFNRKQFLHFMKMKRNQ